MPLDVGRVTHLGDKMHRAEASNGSAIASNWLLSTDGTKAVTWRPEASSSSLSYGSNGTEVSNSSAAGASVLVSAADHRHKGVHSVTAAGSNALYGDVNLVSGSGTAITAVGNSLTIATVAVAGSSSSGGTTLPLDVAPASPSSWDDEFTSATLDSKWLQATSNAGSDATYTIANGWIRIESNTAGTSSTGKHAIGYRQVSPTGSFKIWTKHVPGNISGADIRSGIFMAISGGKAFVEGTFIQDNGGAYIGITTMSRTADWSAYNGTLSGNGVTGVNQNMAWYRMRWNASTTTVYWDYSHNGVMWRNQTSAGGQTQPTDLGFVIYSNSGTINADQADFFDYIRVEENADF